MDLTWTKRYPDKDELKKEINVMIDSFVHVILKYIPEKEIKGIYFKGSSQKNWDSIIDYVPELSDIDIHLLIKNDFYADQKRNFTLDKAFKMQSDIEREFAANVTKRWHIPRPQFILLNELADKDDYLPAPPNAVSTLFGEPYACNMPEKSIYIDIDKKKMLKEEPYIKDYAFNVIDQIGKYMKFPLRNINYRISPVGPRVLDILGVSPEDSWAINRTAIVKKLYNLGEGKLAHDYAMYYKCGWEYFLSDYRDADAARKGLLAGFKVLKRGIEVAKKYN